MLPDINQSRSGAHPHAPPTQPLAAPQQAKSDPAVHGMAMTDMIVSLATAEVATPFEREVPAKEPADYFGPIRSTIKAYAPHQLPKSVRIVSHLVLEALPAALMVLTIVTALITLGWFIFLFYVTYL